MACPLEDKNRWSILTKYTFKKIFIFDSQSPINIDFLENLLFELIDKMEAYLENKYIDLRATLLPDLYIRETDGKINVELELELSVSPLSPHHKDESKIAEEIANVFFREFERKIRPEGN